MEKLRRNKWAAIFFMLLSAILCAIMAMGIMVASGDNDISLVIAKINLAFEDNVYILYAVDSQGIEDKEQIKVFVWDVSQEEYLYDDENSISLSCYDVMDIDGKDYAVFVYDRLSAKQMTDEVYAVAYYDGVYSAPKKYSILQYAHNKIKDSDNQNLKNMLINMLAYGASAQIYYDYKTDTLATDTYYTVRVENGSLADGFKKGLYKSGTEITVIADEPAEGKNFTQWTDGESNVLGTSQTLNYVLNGDVTITAQYEDANVSVEPTFVVQSVNAAAGATNIAVTVSVKNNPGISSIALSIAYDAGITLTGFTYNSAVIGGQSAGYNANAFPPKLVWTNFNTNVEGDWVFATLYFSVDVSASGTYHISVTYDEDDVYDVNEDNIDFKIMNGGITVQ